MSKPALSDADFERMFKEVGPTEMASRLKIRERNVYDRRQRLEAKLGRQITGPDHHNRTRFHIDHPQRIRLDVPDGVVLVGSDGHYWPGEVSTAHRAFVKFAKDMKPKAVVFNGDAFDGASVSRHPPIGWAGLPTVQDEIEACQDRLDEIVKAMPKGCRKVWTLGNHDSRFETRIATVAPEYAKVAGVSLKDHFPLWEPAWSCWVNNDCVIKHRFKGGIYAPANNTLWAGKTMVTGHLHSSKVQPITDYNGTRYGVDTGCLAEPFGEPFIDYTEDSPRNWRSGFCVLTFIDGKLLAPELVSVWDEGVVQFRGELVEV